MLMSIFVLTCAPLNLNLSPATPLSILDDRRAARREKRTVVSAGEISTTTPTDALTLKFSRLISHNPVKRVRFRRGEVRSENNLVICTILKPVEMRQHVKTRSRYMSYEAAENRQN